MAIENQKAPSIGSVELSFDEKGNRVRQIVPEPVSTEMELVPILTNAQMFTEQKGATRSVVRALVPDDFLRNSEDIALCLKWDTEATIPLSGRYGGVSFVYFSRNSQTRTTTHHSSMQENALLRHINEKPRKEIPSVVQKAIKGGFTLELLDKVTDRDLERLAEMYTHSFSSYPFEISEAKTIQNMIEDPSVHVCVARSKEDNLLYAVSATELVTLPGSGFRMREMGDSAKMPGVNGLNAPLKIMLAAESIIRDGQVDLVFCETRAALGAVNAINHSIGMSYHGTLSKHTVISGPCDVDEVGLDGEVNGRYGNMNVWAFSENQIREVSAALA